MIPLTRPLAIAMLTRAAYDAHGRDRAGLDRHDMPMMRDRLAHWLCDPDYGDVTLRECCDIAGLDTDTVRAELLRAMEGRS